MHCPTRCCLKNSFFAAALPLLVVSCSGGGDAGHSLFPLGDGARWEYSIVETTQRWIDEGELVMVGLGEREHQGDRYLVRVNQHDTEYYFRSDSDGIYRVGKRTVGQREVAFDPEPRFVIKYPAEVGQRWFGESHPYVIERMEPFREEFTRSNSFQMIYTIEAVDETVRVPAGEFTNAIKVSGEGKAVLLAELAKGRYGANEAEIDTVEWYAPGVGLVKLVRIESFPNNLFVDGVVTFELKSYMP